MTRYVTALLSSPTGPYFEGEEKVQLSKHFFDSFYQLFTNFKDNSVSQEGRSVSFLSWFNLV